MVKINNFRLSAALHGFLFAPTISAMIKGDTSIFPPVILILVIVMTVLDYQMRSAK